MSKFTNPLDNIRVASPCTTNWDEMYGDDRKRFCGECKLNVYNLSDMNRQEAENLLLNSEGRLCVRFFRRADGTLLTKDCPVGWKAVKRRVSHTATAAFSLFAGFFMGLTGSNFTTGTSDMTEISIPPVGDDEQTQQFQGRMSADYDRYRDVTPAIVGQISIDPVYPKRGQTPRSVKVYKR